MHNKGRFGYSTAILVKAMHRSLIIILLSAIYSSCFSQEITAVHPLLKSEELERAQEKIFVHTDKSFYITGEILWFKAYCVNAFSNKPSSISKIAYVEILDGSSKPVFQAKIALDQGSGNGSFLIPSSVRSANYSLRAYTSWMKNFSSDLIFHTRISIVNPLKKPDWQAVSKTPSYDIQFFPESGSLVENINSRVAFRAVDQSGKGIVGSGFITDDTGDTIVRFAPLHAGLGSFRLLPRKGRTYMAFMKPAGGETIPVAFPAVAAEGLVMECHPANDQLNIYINATGTQSQNLVLLNINPHESHGKELSAKLVNGTATIAIPVSELKDGTSVLRLETSNHEPLLERLFFKRPEKRAEIVISTDATNYRSRQKVGLDLRIDSALTHFRNDLSLSVFLVDSLQPAVTGELSDYLLLTSFLKGRVEDPAYYFLGSGADVQTATDNLMLVQGYRSIVKTSETRMRFLPEYEGQLITGKLVDRATGQPVSNKPAFLSAPGENYQLSNAVSDQMGNLSFVLDNNYGSTQIIAQADSIYSALINDPFQIDDSLIYVAPFSIPGSREQELVFHSVNAQVQHVFEGDRRNQFIYPLDEDSTSFYGVPDKKFFLDDYTRFPTLEEVLKEFIADVYLKKRGDQYVINLRDIPHSVVFRDPPLILVDGLPVSDIGKLLTLDPLKIKKIEVVNREMTQGSNSYSGVISCSSFNGDLAGYELEKYVTAVSFPGISFQRRFFSPVYDSPERITAPAADTRNQLYWNPSLVLQNRIKTEQEFYTSDIPGNYLIVVQGISSDGRILQGSKIFPVTKN